MCEVTPPDNLNDPTQRMYVCHCNRIPERDIRAAIDTLAARGDTTSVSAGDVLLELNRFGKCLGCFPLIEAMLAGDAAYARLAPVPEAPEPEPVGSVPRRRRRGGAFARRSGS